MIIVCLSILTILTLHSTGAAHRSHHGHPAANMLLCSSSRRWCGWHGLRPTAPTPVRSAASGTPRSRPSQPWCYKDRHPVFVWCLMQMLCCPAAELSRLHYSAAAVGCNAGAGGQVALQVDCRAALQSLSAMFRRPSPKIGMSPARFVRSFSRSESKFPAYVELSADGNRLG